MAGLSATRLICAAAAALVLSGLPVRAQPAGLPRALVEDSLKQADCMHTYERATENLQPVELGNGLKLVEVGCHLWPYNAGSLLFVIDPSAPDKARLLRFRVMEDKRFVETPIVPMADYDPKTRTLRSYHKYRGPGDCGHIGKWTWTGRDFKMSAYWDKPKCDGKLFEASRRWQIFPKR